MRKSGSRVSGFGSWARRCGWACAAVVATSGAALAQPSGPDPRAALAPEEVEIARSGFDDLETAPDDAFDALRGAMDGWGTLVREWASDPDAAPDALTIGEVRALGAGTDPAVAGGLGIVYGQFLEREPMGERPGMERWLLAAADPQSGALSDQTVILFVSRHDSASLKPPQVGWYVWSVAYFYKPLRLPSRSSGDETTYPAFVGAVFRTDALAGGRPSDSVVWYALALAVFFGVAITLLVVVTKLRSKERPRPLAAAASRADEQERRSADDA